MKKMILLPLFIFLFFLFNINGKALTINYGIAKTKNGNRPYPGDNMHNLIVNNNGYYIAADTKDIYLTFDCGYENGYTREILKKLKRRKMLKPYFFYYRSLFKKSATDIVEEMINDGHIIGNHSSNHKKISVRFLQK
ncbi:MAG: polysaccharide deacetylase family protein [Clostridium sp.]|nr:MAG: polysaccharide deacetylase family protein [Clostridium sp.]